MPIGVGYTWSRGSAMAITSSITAQQVGQALAEAVRDEPRISELWVTMWPDAVHVWLIVEPITSQEQRRLYLLTDVLYERFPGTPAMLHVLNPRNYRGDVHVSLPADATQISLESA